MNSISGLSPQQLRRAADIQERILALQDELQSVLGQSAGSFQQPAAPAQQSAPAGGRQGKGKRRLSPQGLANIRAGVLKRQQNRAKSGGGATKKSSNSQANKSRSESMKARWAAAKASGKGRL